MSTNVVPSSTVVSRTDLKEVQRDERQESTGTFLFRLFSESEVQRKEGYDFNGHVRFYRNDVVAHGWHNRTPPPRLRV